MRSFARIRLQNRYRLRMAGFMFFADLTALLSATLLGNYLFNGIDNSSLRSVEIGSLVFLLTCLSLLMASRLYPGVGINPPNEIKLVTQYTFTGLTIGMVFSVVSPSFNLHRFWTLFWIWALSLVFVVGLRWLIRIVAVRLGLWKEPVLLIAKGAQANYLAQYFRKRLRLGLWPVMVATDDEGLASYSEIEGERLIHLRDLPASAPLFSDLGIETALIDLSAAGDTFGPSANRFLSQALPRLIVISDLEWFEGTSLSIHDFEGLLGVEARKNGLSRFDLSIKYAMDILLSLIGIIVLLPCFLLIALLIKLDSPGSVFYMQERIGKNKRRVRIVKFRTMVKDADEVLQAYLRANPSAKQEWEQNQKLKDDPRITRVGKWLRKYSLDELPQFFNVLKGELSLVGARPIVESEAHHYSNHFDLYASAKPGLTGLWQVSGRSCTTYEERVRYDVYYVHNWSIWLDLYILLRTVWVVLSRDGAY